MKLISREPLEEAFCAPSRLAAKNRTHSWRNPIAGPGAPRSGLVWPHGPIKSSDRASDVLDDAKHHVPVAIAPSADCEHGAADRAVVLARGPLLPVRVAALMTEPAAR